MCHFAKEGTAYQCDRCGYEFGQSHEKLREMLLAQLARARTTLWVLLALDAALLAGVFYALTHGFVLLPWPPVVALTWWTVRTRQKIAISKHSLALIHKQQAKLPEAKVVSGA